PGAQLRMERGQAADRISEICAVGLAFADDERPLQADEKTILQKARIEFARRRRVLALLQLVARVDRVFDMVDMAQTSAERGERLDLCGRGCGGGRLTAGGRNNKRMGHWTMIRARGENLMAHRTCPSIIFRSDVYLRIDG